MARPTAVLFIECALGLLVGCGGVTELSQERIFPDVAPEEVSGWPGPEKLIDLWWGKNMPTDVSVPTITPYLAPGADVGLIIMPGGSYYVVNMEGEGRESQQAFNKLGLSVFILKYRVPAVTDGKRLLSPLQDAYRAVAYVRSNAARFSVHPSKLGVLGFSAGGNTAAWIASAWQSRPYAAIDEVDEVSSRPDFALILYPGLKSNHTAASDDPPQFWAQALDDKTCPPAKSLAQFQRIMAAGDEDSAYPKNVKSSSLRLYESGSHGWGMCTDTRDVCKWTQHAMGFMYDNGFLAESPTRPILRSPRTNTTFASDQLELQVLSILCCILSIALLAMCCITCCRNKKSSRCFRNQCSGLSSCQDDGRQRNTASQGMENAQLGTDSNSCSQV
jgi:dienelactone hydrolase